MRLRNIREHKEPPLNIIPMIDIMFFLLVFFMLSTIYMIELKTIPVRLPKAINASVESAATFAVTLKNDGSIYLGEHLIERRLLVANAFQEQKVHPDFVVIIRAEQDVPYGEVIALLDEMKGAGINRFGLAADGKK